MSTITSGQTASFALPKGSIMLITKLYNSNCVFNAVAANGVVIDAGVFGYIPLTAKQYGPYSLDVTMGLACTDGSITYTTATGSGGGGAGGPETVIPVAAGGTINLAALTPGTPINYVVSTNSAVTINLPAPNAATPSGRVNVIGTGTAPNITIVPVSGLIGGAANQVINQQNMSLIFMDDGTNYLSQ